MKRPRLIAAMMATVTTLAIAACGGTGTTTNGPISSYDANPATINIVAGSEQREVLEKVVKPWCDTNGMKCNFDLLGSVDQARLLQSGAASYDAFWFASSVFEQLGNQNNTLQEVQPTSVSPIVYAGKRSVMERLGFVGRDVTIQEILAAVESGKTKVWVTNPSQSNSGATVLLGFANYFAGNGPGVPLTLAQLDSPQVKEGISRFTKAFDRTPPSTGTLTDECVADTACETMFTYEELAIAKNRQLASGQEPLYMVYPKGALAISDAPLGFFPHGNNPEKRANFLKLQQFLLSANGQQQLLQLGRRPAASIGLSMSNAPADIFNPAWGVKTDLHEQPITYPATTVIQVALDRYQTEYRRPGDVIYCIDGSGSMAENGGWDGVQQAAKLLFDPNQARTYLLQVNPQDRTTVLIFDSNVKNDPPWVVDGNQAEQLLDLKSKINNESPGGGTGIFRCIGKADQLFRSTPDTGRKRLLVLMTDGQDGEGDNGELDSFAALGIPIIAVGFGSADENALRAITNRTGGSYIDGSKDLPTALRQATGWK